MNPVSLTRAFLSVAVLPVLLLCSSLSGFAAPGKPLPDSAGDVAALAGMISHLDRAAPGFYMHVR